LTQTDDVALEQAIAVVGMACRFPGAADVETFWRNLRDGVESISRFSPAQLIAAGVPAEAVRDSHYVPAAGALPDIDRFDAEFFGATPREAALLDPQQRLFLECAWEALEVAGCDSERFDGRIAVYGGVGMSAYRMRNLAGADGLPNVSRLQIELSTDKDYVATRASYKLNLRGPSMTVQTACSTSLTAVQLACQSLLVHQADMALAGGGTVSVPQEEGYWYEEGSILSPDGHCRAFDVEARGTVPGCGVGVVALKRLEDALANGDHVLAVIRSAAVNNDGAQRVGFTAPSLEGQAEVIAEAHALAGVDPRTITYVEAHGTGTPVGDPIEVRALTRAFRMATRDRAFCALGSVKTNVGHLDAAAGVAGLIKAVQALRHGEIPPTLHFNRANPACELDDSPFFVNAELRPWPVNGTPRRAGVSSFGLGGTNVHVVLEEAPPTAPGAPGRPSSLLVLSARSLPALDRAAANLAAHLRDHPELELADVAHTLQAGRRQFEQRRAAVCRDRDQALAALEGADPTLRPIDGRAAAGASVVFLLPGQGSQHARMGQHLYEHEPVYRRWLDRCCELAEPHVGLDLRRALAALAGSPEAAELEQTRLAQPALFAVEYALAQTWIEWGVRPAAMLGHSLGEYVAACLAGVFTLDEGMALVAARGRLMQEIQPGAMLAVSCPVEEVERRLPAGLALAAVNAPRQCVVSGPGPLVEAFQQQLGESLVTSRRLDTSHAFHSAMLDPMVGPFVEAVGRLDLRPPELPFVSNVHGGWITPAEATDPAYWGRQVRQPVRFAAGVRTALADPSAILLEVGPSIALSSLARLQPEAGRRGVIASLRHAQDANTADREALLAALGRVWALGAPVDWAAFGRPERRRSVPLPTYSFERQRHWVEWHPSTNGAAQPLTFAAAVDAAAEGPEPDGRYVAPRTEMEELVARIWQDHLGLRRPIGVNESFFALGGQSLLAVEVATALRTGLDLPISINTVFQNPSVYELARAIEEMRGDAPAEPASEEEALLARIEAMSADEVEVRLRAEAEAGLDSLSERVQAG
jgi:acyl transferase domain-containing protein